MSGVGEEAGESNGSSVPEGFETAVGAEPVKLDGSKLSTDPQKRNTPQKRTQKPPVGQAAPIKAMEGCVPWDLGVVLKSTQVDLTLAQLLNDSPKLRKQLGVG